MVMLIMSKVFDKRINSWNFYVESTFGEYLKFAKKIINNNELQRKRVKTSKTIYSLLKNDLQKGCIMPPLVLALVKTDIIDIENPDQEKMLQYINENSENVLLLDGLQRTYTLIDADTDMKKKSDEEYQKFLKNKLRLEIYVEINKFGILYRMLYSDMLNTEFEGVKLVTDKEGKADPDENEFIFKNAIEGFNSYMNRNELPIDRQDILENVKMLENMSEEDVSKDLFKEFLETYMKLFGMLRKITDNHIVDEEELIEYGISESPFGKKVSKIFSTSQVLTGFGAAVGKMKDLDIIQSLEDVSKLVDKLEEKNKGYVWMMELLNKLDRIKVSSKKIGNAQRMFFQYFFRELLNSESDSYLDLEAAVQNGYKKYYSQVI